MWSYGKRTFRRLWLLKVIILNFNLYIEVQTPRKNNSQEVDLYRPENPSAKKFLPLRAYMPWVWLYAQVICIFQSEQVFTFWRCIHLLRISKSHLSQQTAAFYYHGGREVTQACPVPRSRIPLSLSARPRRTAIERKEKGLVQGATAITTTRVGYKNGELRTKRQFFNERRFVIITLYMALAQ